MKKAITICFLLFTFSKITGQNIPAYVPANGLVTWYPFNGNANDQSGNGYNGTVTGASQTSDRFGNANSAYKFNGNSDFIDVADNTALRLSNTDFTISVWINETSRASTQEAIISKRTGVGGNGYILNIEGSVQAIPGLTNFHVSGGLDPRAYSNSIVPLNVWKHITLIYQLSSQIFKTYIDGVLDSSTPGISSPNAMTNVVMKIGTDAAGNPYFFHGKIDDIGIWSRALTECEIASLNDTIFRPTYDINKTANVCYGDSIILGGAYQNTPGIYIDTLSTVLGCDSVLHTTLTVNAAINVGTTLNGLTLSANLAGATYQWLNNCPNYTVIVGATNQSYTALANGNYAVIVTVGNCSDTSLCTSINIVGIESTDNEFRITAYPNPTNSVFTIHCSHFQMREILVLDVFGRQIFQSTCNVYESSIDLSSQPKGLYFVKVYAGEKIYTEKIIVE